MSFNAYAKVWTWLICLVWAGLFVSGCAHEQSPEQPVQDVEPIVAPVISHDTMFYSSGPQQARPPDGQFKAGTRVMIIQEAGSYTLVRAEDGREGYVASDAVSVPQDKD